MQLNADSRIVMTLDAGGTNLRFSAIRGNQLLFDPISDAHRGRQPHPLPGQHRRGLHAGPRPLPRAAGGDQLRVSRARSIIRRASSAIWATCPAFAAASPWGRCSKSDFGLPDVPEQRRRPVHLRRSDLRLPALRQRAAQGRRQRETVQEPVRHHARHRLRRRNRPQRRALHRRQRRRRRNLGRRAANCTTAASSKRTSASAPFSGSTRNTRR